MTVRAAFLAWVTLAVTLLGWLRPRTPEPAGRASGFQTRWIEVPIEPRPEVTEDLLALGSRLYGWNCLPCHGAEGKGDGPVAERLGLGPGDHTRGWFKLKTSKEGEMPFDEDLYRTITTGILPSGMPSFATFEPDERWALVAFVKTLAQPHFDRFPPKARATLPARPPSGDLAAGTRLFLTAAGCAICHGPSGRGDGMAAAGLVDVRGRPVGAPDLSRGELTFKSGDRPEDVFRVLTTGMPGSPMPAFTSLPEEDRWNLAFYVTTLFEPIQPGERLYWRLGCGRCHSIGHGRVVGPDLAAVAQRRNPAWLREWLRDPPRMLLDPALRAEFKDYPTPMPNLNLSDGEIEALISFFTQVGVKEITPR